jgi:hypothetical protein
MSFSVRSAHATLYQADLCLNTGDYITALTSLLLPRKDGNTLRQRNAAMSQYRSGLLFSGVTLMLHGEGHRKKRGTRWSGVCFDGFGGVMGLQKQSSKCLTLSCLREQLAGAV